MQQSFDTLLDSFIDNGVGVADNFLSGELAASLRQNLLTHHNSELLVPARIGNGNAVNLDVQVRGDKIRWLDRLNFDLVENSYLDLVDSFVEYLNRSCYAGVKDYEFHYTMYEAGRFYKRHLDKFRTDNSRMYSMIVYLNPNWQEGDGGELCIHHENTEQHIAPLNGRAVFFKSHEMEHEVMMTHKPRLSITGWLKV